MSKLRLKTWILLGILNNQYFTLWVTIWLGKRNLFPLYFQDIDTSQNLELKTDHERTLQRSLTHFICKRKRAEQLCNSLDSWLRMVNSCWQVHVTESYFSPHLSCSSRAHVMSMSTYRNRRIWSDKKIIINPFPWKVYFISSMVKTDERLLQYVFVRFINGWKAIIEKD